MKTIILITIMVFSMKGYSQIETDMKDDSTKLDLEEYILPIYKQLKIKGGKLNHRISNKRPHQKYIEDVYITIYMEPLKIVDPIYGESYSENPQMWFEQLYTEGKFSLKSIIDLENASYKFSPGEVLGTFSNSIDIMVLNLDFGKLIDDKIDLRIKFSFTNRDNFFKGNFKRHSEKFLIAETTLEIDKLVYLDYQNSTENVGKLSRYLDSTLYDLEKIEEYNYGWKDNGMKPYKIPMKK